MEARRKERLGLGWGGYGDTKDPSARRVFSVVLVLGMALAGSLNAATLWDESAWGNLPGSMEAPAPFLVADARNVFKGHTSSFDRDRLTLHVPPGESLTGLYLRATDATPDGLVVDLYEGTDVSGSPLATLFLDDLDIDTAVATSELAGLTAVTLEVSGAFSVLVSYVLEFQSTRNALATEWDAGGDAQAADPGYDVGSLQSARNQILAWDLDSGDQADWFRFTVPWDATGTGIFLQDLLREGAGPVALWLYDGNGNQTGTVVLDGPTEGNLLGLGLGLDTLDPGSAYQLRVIYGASDVPRRGGGQTRILLGRPGSAPESGCLSAFIVNHLDGDVVMARTLGEHEPLNLHLTFEDSAC